MRDERDLIRKATYGSGGYVLYREDNPHHFSGRDDEGSELEPESAADDEAWMLEKETASGCSLDQPEVEN